MLPEGNRLQSLKDGIIHHWSPQCLAGRERRSNMTGLSLKLLTRHGGFFYVNIRHRLLPHHGPNPHKARPFRGTRLKSPQGVRDLLLGATSGYLIKPASCWTYVELASRFLRNRTPNWIEGQHTTTAFVSVKCIFSLWDHHWPMRRRQQSKTLVEG